MISSEITIGRSVLVVIEPGEMVVEQVLTACREHGVTQGFVPMFLGAFTWVTMIGTCAPTPDHHVPMAGRVHLENVEGSGSGTLCLDPDTGDSVFHLHAAVGVKHYSANGYAGHVIDAQIQYVAEVVVQEVMQPAMTRRTHPGSAGLPILWF